MTELDKLRVLLPHWIEHNKGHGNEFTKWASFCREHSAPDLAALLDLAIAQLQQASETLTEALEKMGGPGPSHHHHDH
jgi:hypothetical protein